MALSEPATRIGVIVRGERAVTADTALRLARFSGTGPEFWITLQATHDLTKPGRKAAGRSRGTCGHVRRQDTVARDEADRYNKPAPDRAWTFATRASDPHRGERRVSR